MTLDEVCNRIVKHDRPDLVPRAKYFDMILSSVLDKRLNRDSSIIQYGCACGYMLDILKLHGYTDLTGVDKDPEMAKDWMEGVKFVPNTARFALKSMPKHDVVLLHRFLYILPETAQNEELFQLIAKSFNKYLIVIEEEVGTNGNGNPVRYYRNYQSLFEKLGLKQIWDNSGQVQNVTARIFIR